MDFVILSLVMLAIGIYGLLTNRQLLKVFISIELIATAATINFIMLAISARHWGSIVDFGVLSGYGC